MEGVRIHGFPVSTWTRTACNLAPQISNAEEKAPGVLDGLDAVRAWFAVVSDRESFRATAYDPAEL